MPIRARHFLVVIYCFAALGVWTAESANKLSNAAEAAFRDGNFDSAIALYTEVIAANPKDAIAYSNRAIAYRQKKNYAAAIADLDEALRLKPGWIFWYNRGVAYSESGDDASAIADYGRALKAGPSIPLARADCLLARAHCYFHQENSAPAMADVNAAIKLGVKTPDAYILRGVLHKIAHEYEQSLSDYEKAIALAPKESRAYGAEAYLLAVCPAPKYRDGQKAIRYATKACELTAWRDAEEIETLGVAYAEAGRFEEAIKFQKQAETLDRRHGDFERLALYERRQPFRDLNRKEKAVPLPSQGSISIKLGQKLNAHFEVDGEQFINPTPMKAGKPEENCFALDFHLAKDGRLLTLEHSFPKVVRVKCLARLKGQDAYFETDVLPIAPHVINREIWSEKIEELVLFDFHFLNDEPQESITAL